MKVTSGAAERFVRAPDPRVVAVLLYGPDQGVARERRETLLRAWSVDPADPFGVTQLDEGEVRSDPARLGDEMRAMTLGGGARVVRLALDTEYASGAVAEVLKEIDTGALAPAAKLVVDAGELAPSSKLRKAFETSASAGAVACYEDGPREVAAQITATLKEHGLAIEDDARERLAERLAGDRAILRAELEKLVLYMGDDAAGPIALADIDAVVSGAEPGDLDALVDAALSGALAEADRHVARALDAGVTPVGVARALQRRLLILRDAATVGGSADAALGRVAPWLKGPPKDAAKRQLAMWDLARLERALSETLKAEVAMKTTGAPDAALAGRLVLALAGAARRRG